jgi:hypothetical protein
MRGSGERKEEVGKFSGRDVIGEDKMEWSLENTGMEWRWIQSRTEWNGVGRTLEWTIEEVMEVDLTF